jgi:hypothetical protein
VPRPRRGSPRLIAIIVHRSTWASCVGAWSRGTAPARTWRPRRLRHAPRRRGCGASQPRDWWSVEAAKLPRCASLARALTVPAASAPAPRGDDGARPAARDGLPGFSRSACRRPRAPGPNEEVLARGAGGRRRAIRALPSGGFAPGED